MSKQGDYEVGYGRPPKQTQFKRGQSGNPRGRPKGAKGVRPTLEKILDTRVPVQDTHGSRRVPVLEAALLALAFRAMKGEVRAIKLFLEQIAQHDLDRSPDEPQRTGVLVVPATLTPEEWNAKFGPPVHIGPDD